MIRALCPVCKRPQTLNQHGRLDTHRRKTESPLVRDRVGSLGVLCEGSGRLPIQHGEAYRETAVNVRTDPPP